jgi:hypothetical protein
MKPAPKWTIGLLWGLTLAVPLSVVLWMRVDYDRSYLRLQRDAQETIAQFQQRLNAENFDVICRRASSCEDYLNPAENWRSHLEHIRNHFGAFQEVRKSRVAVNVELGRVVADFDSSFEKGLLNERFVMKEVDGRLKLIMYMSNAKTEDAPVRKDPAKE